MEMGWERVGLGREMCWGQRYDGDEDGFGEDDGQRATR